MPDKRSPIQCIHRLDGTASRPIIFFICGMIAIAGAGCHSDMYDQPRTKPLRPSGFFPDGQSSRPLEEGTVPHSTEPRDELLNTGRINGTIADIFPFPVTQEVVARGQERFNIFCSPCHGRLADGRGMIVQRGFPPPPSFHTDSLLQKPAGHFVDVITNGFGRMYSYADRIEPRDRWAIAAYIRALQLSQNVKTRSLPGGQQQQANSP